MDDRNLRAALISTDSGFTDQVRAALARADLGVALALESPVRFAEFDEDHVQALRKLSPELVIVDLQDDPDLGVKFIHFLSEGAVNQKVIAVGPTLEPDLLLAAMRAGISDYLLKPVSVEALTVAVQRTSQQLGRGAERATRKPGQLYTFFSSKGGSGSTTIATNMAIVLHRLSGKRTLLVDLDLELGEVALLLGVQPRFNFVDMVQNFHRMDSGLLASYIEQHSSGVHLLSAPFHPERAEVVSGDEIRRILLFLRQHYDYVVVDTSKSFSPATLAAVDQSDLVFLVANLDLPSLRNIQRSLPMLRRVLARGEEHLRLIVNRYQADGDISLDDVSRTLGLKVFWTISNDYGAVVDSINTGKPIVLNGTSAYTKDIKALGAQIAGLRPDGAGDRRGVVGRLMGRFRRPGARKKP
jgi:pilus assembly protein CpaE